MERLKTARGLRRVVVEPIPPQRNEHTTKRAASPADGGAGDRRPRGQSEGSTAPQTFHRQNPPEQPAKGPRRLLEASTGRRLGKRCGA